MPNKPEPSWGEVDYTAQYELLMAMSPEERRVHFLSDKVDTEQYWLEHMLIDWRDERAVSMGEIREQRKRVQEWQKKLNEAKQKQSEREQSVKLKQSSSNSET